VEEVLGADAAVATVCRRQGFDGEVTLCDTDAGATVKATTHGPAEL
jgi:hypothetical protein